jgi:ribosomal protein S12
MIYETHLKQSANYMSFTQLYKTRQTNKIINMHIPQYQGRIRKLVIRKPRKPNSAKRKTAKIYSRRFKFCLAKISGNEYFPIKFASVIISPPGSRDTPNVN